jgi:hypothetical protein
MLKSKTNGPGLRTLRGEGSSLALIACGCLLGFPAVSFAQFENTIDVGTRYQHESNVFEFPGGTPLPPGATFGDTSYAYFGGLDSTYRWSQQALGLEATVSHTNYDHDSQYDRTEYLIRPHLDWSLGNELTGTAVVSRQRTVTPLEQELLATQLLLDTTTAENLTANYQFRPDWLLQASLYHHEDDEPLPGNPDFSLKETTERVALEFGAPQTLQIGLSAEYLDGTFAGGNPGAPDAYHQVTSQVVATHSVGDLSAFDGALGYTRREFAPDGVHNGGVTGMLAYRRKLTGKTSVRFSVQRVVNTYAATSSAELDSIALAEVTWQATTKIDVTLGYTWTYSDFGVQLAEDDTPYSRLDHYQQARFALHYRPVEWLIIRPYAQYQRRTSNVPPAAFTGNMVGIELTGEIKK